MLRTFTTFDADFPPEPDQGDDGLPPGRPIMERLAQLLRDAGLTASAVEQHEYYGWSIDVGDGGERFWLLLQASDQWLLISTQHVGFLRRLTGVDPGPHRRLSETIHQVLGKDSRFDGVSWFTRAEFERGEDQGQPKP